MRFATRVLGGVSGVALAIAATPARAHVAPAQGENNRYIKVLPFGDRVRIAYTIFYGETPGRALRRALDTDHDGLISDGEAQAYGDKLAPQVAAALELEVDGVRQPLTWTEVSVGLGMPATTAGAWSIDLVAWPCTAAHHVVLRDKYDLPLIGETELWVVDMPNIHIDRARIGAMDDPTHDFQFTGRLRELASEGLDLTYTAGPHAGPGFAGACSTGAAAARPAPRWPLLLTAGAGALLGLLLLLRRRAPPGRRRGTESKLSSAGSTDPE